MKIRRFDAPPRSVTDVDAGDYVKVKGGWKEIASNSAAGAKHTPHRWTVRTTDGCEYAMWDILRYAKREDLI